MILLRTMMLMQTQMTVHVLGTAVVLLLLMLLVMMVYVSLRLISVMDQVSMEMLHGVQTVLMVQMKELNVANLAIMLQIFV